MLNNLRNQGARGQGGSSAQRRELNAYPKSTENSQASFTNNNPCFDELDTIRRELEAFPQRVDPRSHSQLLDWLVGKELQLSKLKYPDAPHESYDGVRERADALLREVHQMKERFKRKQEGDRELLVSPLSSNYGSPEGADSSQIMLQEVSPAPVFFSASDEDESEARAARDNFAQVAKSQAEDFIRHRHHRHPLQISRELAGTTGALPSYLRQDISIQQQLAFSDGQNDRSLASPVLVVDRPGRQGAARLPPQPAVKQYPREISRRGGEGRNNYQALKSKFHKARSKTQQMKSVLQDYAEKMREMQDRMEVQRKEAQEHERLQVSTREQMRSQFEDVVGTLKQSARVLNGKVHRLERENKELSNYVALVTARDARPHTTRAQDTLPGVAHSFTVSRQVNTTATTSRIKEAATPSSLKTSPSPSCARSVDTPLAEELAFYKTKLTDMAAENERMKDLVAQKDTDAQHSLQEMRTHYRQKKHKYKRHIRDLEAAKHQINELMRRATNDLKKKEQEANQFSARLNDYYRELQSAREEKARIEEKLNKANRELRAQERRVFEAQEREIAAAGRQRESQEELERVRLENQALSAQKADRDDLISKERASLQESMVYWRNQTKELEKKLELKEQRKETYTTLQQELSSYDSAAERASYLPIAWDGANRTVETVVPAEQEIQRNLERLVEGYTVDEEGPWLDQLLGGLQARELRRYVERLGEAGAQWRREREELQGELEQARGVLGQLEMEKKQLNERWMSANQQGLEKIKSDMEQLKHIMTAKTPRVPTLPLPPPSTVSDTSTGRLHAEWSRRRGSSSALSARLDGLVEVLDRIEGQVAQEGVQLKQDILEAKGQIEILQRQSHRRSSDQDEDELREALALSKKNMQELQTLYGEKEKEVVMLQKYLDECQAINARLRQISDQNDRDIHRLLEERDRLRSKLQAAERQLGGLKRVLKKSERLDEVLLKQQPRGIGGGAGEDPSVSAQLRQTRLENEHMKEQNANLKEKLLMMEKFQQTFASPEPSVREFLKSGKHSDLFRLSDDKTPPQRLPSLPVTSENHSLKDDSSCKSEAQGLTVESEQTLYKLHSPPPLLSPAGGQARPPCLGKDIIPYEEVQPTPGFESERMDRMSG